MSRFKLRFKGANRFVILDIDRDNKILKVSSSKTRYKFVEQPWAMLFDKGKEKFQETISDRLNDNQFIKEIIYSMAKVGYRLVKR